ncbi:MAG: hypothetical protein FWC50_15980, partial [Planctomycetaceae bacterium]|nr:hypothetical protein [Planctomycetaceae bacterium]
MGAILSKIPYQIVFRFSNCSELEFDGVLVVVINQDIGARPLLLKENHKKRQITFAVCLENARKKQVILISSVSAAVFPAAFAWFLGTGFIDSQCPVSQFHAV